METAYPDIDVIGHLDWEETFPCEYSAHDQYHVPEQSASYMVKVTHTPCGDSFQYLICLSGYEALVSWPTLWCNGDSGCDMNDEAKNFTIIRTGVLM